MNRTKKKRSMEEEKEVRKIKVCSHLSSPLHFQTASISPEPASEKQKLYAAIWPLAHQHCNSNKHISHIRTKDIFFLFVNWKLLGRVFFFLWNVRNTLLAKIISKLGLRYLKSVSLFSSNHFMSHRSNFFWTLVWSTMGKILANASDYSVDLHIMFDDFRLI